MEPVFETTLRRGAKSATAFRTISEVAEDLNVPQHVLRFWETRFSQVRPLKRAGGRRYYRPEDVDLLRRIRELLYKHGYTIKGVQKLLREGARAPIEAAGEETPSSTARDRGAPAPVATAVPPAIAVAEQQTEAEARAAIEAVIDELTLLRDLLRNRRG